MTTLNLYHEELRIRINEWKVQHHVEDTIFDECFTDGWSACMDTAMAPAVHLAVILKSMASIKTEKNLPEDYKMTLTAQPLAILLDLCNQILGENNDEELKKLFDLVDLKDAD